MVSRPLAATAAGLCLALAAPALSQSAAQQPALTAEQAIQLFAEAGFPVQDGAPVNRCGKPSNPRIAFVDLNADGAAEAHIADVDPACYGKPGAYFAILAQQPDKSWKRLIAEDGIVGFQRTRSSGWNDLSLEARDSDCPGARRFNGTDYGTTACGLTVAAALAPADAPAATPAAQTGALTGTRTEQIAQLFRNIVGATQTRSWDAAMAAFAGAKWQSRTTHSRNWFGSTVTQGGTIEIGGAIYGVDIGGTETRINTILFDSPGDDQMEWGAIEAAMRALGMQSNNIGCHSPSGFGWVRLTADGHSAILHKSVNYGSAVPSTDIYSFTPDNPFDGKTEAQVAADRSLC